MAMAYGDDLRMRLVGGVRDGGKIREVAEIFDVAPSTVAKAHQRWRETGKISAKAMGGDRRSHHIEAHAEVIMGLIEARADITLEEIREVLAARKFETSITSIWRFFERRKISFKKNTLRQRTTAR